jgi:glycyl-tRNA synthetase beta chain
MMERLKAYYKDANIDSSVYEAVLAVKPNSPFDFHLRVDALNEFIQSADSKSLIESNKRIANILKDSTENHSELISKMLVEDSEKNLYKATELLSKQLLDKQDYKTIMRSLLDLKGVIDAFFDNVMVNTEDLEVREARLALISRVRVLFLSVADISHLSS